jgi:ubiquinone/menaquinone biosynthesis C-methylase UbiE
VIGIDIVTELLEIGRRSAEQANVDDRCEFTTAFAGKVDRLICIDGFEHFADPGKVLATMASWLNDNGRVLVSFGPPWFHPYGGHSFSVFPWAHLLFSEGSLCRWRSNYCEDGAKRFHEVRGGLNQMTVRRFERIVRDSPFQMFDFEAIPIQPARFLHNRLTREFFTSMVRCKLELK